MDSDFYTEVIGGADLTSGAGSKVVKSDAVKFWGSLNVTKVMHACKLGTR